MATMADRDTAAGAPAGATQERGQSLLARISSEIVHTLKEYYGKGPESAKSYLMDDLLLVVMRGGLTKPEKFLLEHREEDVVRAYRQTFQNRMDAVLSTRIEELTGRKVVGYQSQVLFEPEVAIEIFFFDDHVEDPIVSTALSQLDWDPVGELGGDDADQPPGSTADRGG